MAAFRKAPDGHSLITPMAAIDQATYEVRVKLLHCQNCVQPPVFYARLLAITSNLQQGKYRQHLINKTLNIDHSF